VVTRAYFSKAPFSDPVLRSVAVEALSVPIWPCLSWHIDRANKLFERINTALSAVCFESLRHLDARSRVDEIDGSSLHGTGTRKHEFNNVAPGSTDIPIIASGGASTWRDVVEFMLAGASAVQAGTVNFVNPRASVEMAEGLETYCRQCGINSLEQLVGAVNMP
jgi:hypothetical protein